jgi:hypothetical protein
MLKFRFSLGTFIAGLLLLAMPVLDMLVGGGAPSLVHAIVGGFGLAMLAISAAADAGS